MADLESTHWGIVNVRTAYLTEGDTMVLSNGNVTFADWKSNMQCIDARNILRIQNCLYLFLNISQNFMRKYMVLKQKYNEIQVYCYYFLKFSEQLKNT